MPYRDSICLSMPNNCICRKWLAVPFKVDLVAPHTYFRYIICTVMLKIVIIHRLLRLQGHCVCVNCCCLKLDTEFEYILLVFTKGSSESQTRRSKSRKILVSLSYLIVTRFFRHPEITVSIQSKVTEGAFLLALKFPGSLPQD